MESFALVRDGAVCGTTSVCPLTPVPATRPPAPEKRINPRAAKYRFCRAPATLGMLLLLAACSPHPRMEMCAAGMVARLYLGQATPAGVVSEAQWQRFMVDAATPRFPEGFTVLDAKGQWRAPDGAVHQESTRVLEIAHDGTPLTQARVRAIAHAWQQQFSQHSVLFTQALSNLCS